MKKQAVKRKQYDYNKRSAKNRETLNSGDMTMNNNGDIDVQVQNIWEANYMFNKAGCGLPTDDVALISLTMSRMAQLNKFKSVRYDSIVRIKIYELYKIKCIKITFRFWGKIFGLKNMYYVIECEWTNAELQRKLLVRVYTTSTVILHFHNSYSKYCQNNFELKCFKNIFNKFN